jgi:hypothetical protein
LKQRNLRNKGVSFIVAVSIILAAIVTITVTFQAFVVPELNREHAFVHTQDVLDTLNNLYSNQEASLPLSYSGIPFFSPPTFVGQLSFSSDAKLNMTINGVKEVREVEADVDPNSTRSIADLSTALLTFQQVSENIEVNVTLTNGEEESVFYLTSENYSSTLTRIQLNVTLDAATTTYNYTICDGDSFEVDLFAPIYDAASALERALTLHYVTTSSDSVFFVKYTQIDLVNVNHTSRGTLLYDPSNFPLSYVATPWGVASLQGGTSSIPSSQQIYWGHDTLILNLYNLTWSAGTVSGTGSVKINYLTNDLVMVDSSFSQMTLNFSSNNFNLENSVSQLAEILRSGAPEHLLVTLQENDDWSEITITAVTGEGKLNLIINNVEATIV